MLLYAPRAASQRVIPLHRNARPALSYLLRPRHSVLCRYKKFRLKWEKDVMRHTPSAGKKKKGVAKP
jgi:hypothetical protein